MMIDDLPVRIALDGGISIATCDYGRGMGFVLAYALVVNLPSIFVWNEI